MVQRAAHSAKQNTERDRFGGLLNYSDTELSDPETALIVDSASWDHLLLLIYAQNERKSAYFD